MTGRVLVVPLDAEIVVQDGETLMAAAERSGYRWPTVCHGDGECGVCYVIVESGAERLSPMGTGERATLERVRRANDSRVRLACQLEVYGSVRVSKPGVRRR